MGLYTLNKLKQAKDFVSKNPVKASAVGLALASVPFFTYAGCKYYFGKEDAGLEKSEEVNKEVSGNKTVEEIKNEVNNVPVDEKKIHDSNKPTNRVQTEQSKSNSDDTEVEKNAKVDSNTAAADSANNSTDSTSSAAGINTGNENANTDKNLSSVYFGVYSEPIVYLVLCLISKIPEIEKLNLLEKWYNFWHYQNGRSAHPLKMLLATFLFIDSCFLICSVFYQIWFMIKTKITKKITYRCFLMSLMAVSPVLSRVGARGIARDAHWDITIPCIFGTGNSWIFWTFICNKDHAMLRSFFPQD